jgi:hypothetical protein
MLYYVGIKSILCDIQSTYCKFVIYQIGKYSELSTKNRICF